MALDAAPLFRRIGEAARPRVEIVVDGVPVAAHDGDTLLVAILAARGRLRVDELDGRPRAGFCLMGACQDRGVWTEDGEQLRACTTAIRAGMRVATGQPAWPNPRS